MPKEGITVKPSKSFVGMFWWVGIILFLAIIIIIFLFLGKKRNNTQGVPSFISLIKQGNKKDDPPLLIKNLPVNLAPYNPATGMAGDLKFTNQKLQFDMLYEDYGFYIPASPDYPGKYNLQPTFIAPLGTKVRSMVDGYVVAVGKVWSGDYSIGVGEKNQLSEYVYETEHVINPLVKVGDKVKAGQVIAEVSDYDVKNMPGYGVVEMGILRGGNPPRHLCPYLYLDPDTRDSILNSLDTLREDWNKYKGRMIYNTVDYEAPGCLMTRELEG